MGCSLYSPQQDKQNNIRSHGYRCCEDNPISTCFEWNRQVKNVSCASSSPNSDGKHCKAKDEKGNTDFVELAGEDFQYQ